MKAEREAGVADGIENRLNMERWPKKSVQNSRMAYKVREGRNMTASRRRRSFWAAILPV
jgi:hypothetical protein